MNKKITQEYFTQMPLQNKNSFLCYNIYFFKMLKYFFFSFFMQTNAQKDNFFFTMMKYEKLILF
jgi:hypothetical protein